VTVSWHGLNRSLMLFNCGILACLRNSTVAEAVVHAGERTAYPLEIEVSTHTKLGVKEEREPPSAGLTPL
jgi:hypothetical protein